MQRRVDKEKTVSSRGRVACVSLKPFRVAGRLLVRRSFSLGASARAALPHSSPVQLPRTSSDHSPLPSQQSYSFIVLLSRKEETLLICSTSTPAFHRPRAATAMSTLKASSLAPNAPSPTPSNTSANGTKRKRPEESRGNVVYSQPENTDTRNHDMTQLTYAIEHLQQKPDVWFTFKEIMDYLNIRDGDPLRKRLKDSFHNNSPYSKVEYDPASKKYRYKPKYNIRTNSELRQYLQNQKSAQGLSVKDLKDGWPSVQDDLRILEGNKQILVRHNTKDFNARTVYVTCK